MKLLKLIPVMAMALSLVITSCKKEEEDSKLSVSPSSISVNAEKTTQTINVASNTSWTVTETPSWVEVAPAYGTDNGTIQVTVLENTKTEERSDVLVIATNDGTIEKNIKINQKGKVVALSVDVTSINLPSTANASQAINITCNSSWTISGVPDWLQISSISGNGNSSVIITTRNINNSASARSATIVISSEGQSQSITVLQEAALSSCRAVPSNITSLWYAVIFDLTHSSEVAQTKMLLISDYDYLHKTETELIAEIEKEEAQIPSDETIYTRGVKENTKYHILSLSYDKKGERGEMVDVQFESPEFMNATDDAWCTFEDSSYGSSSFWFTVQKRGRCSTYDVIYGANIYPNYLRESLMAYEINYYVTNKKKNWLSEKNNLHIEVNYPNDNTFSCAFNPNGYYGGLIAAAWGIFSDGTRSSDINSVSADVFEEEVNSLNGKREANSAKDWIRSHNGWITTTPKDLKK